MLMRVCACLASKHGLQKVKVCRSPPQLWGLQIVQVSNVYKTRKWEDIRFAKENNSKETAERNDKIDQRLVIIYFDDIAYYRQIKKKFLLWSVGFFSR
ncbi:hypothetical protein E2320_004373 [Naja naja]|nr:hypothetical protein E2320_004373 [Naja naja]